MNIRESLLNVLSARAMSLEELTNTLSIIPTKIVDEIVNLYGLGLVHTFKEKGVIYCQLTTVGQEEQEKGKSSGGMTLDFKVPRLINKQDIEEYRKYRVANGLPDKMKDTMSVQDWAGVVDVKARKIGGKL